MQEPNPSEIWSGNWQQRLLDRIRDTAAPTVESFLSNCPAETYHSVCRNRLGGAAAPVQLLRLQMEEAIRSGRLREAAKDLLVRLIVEKLKRGWNRGGHRKYNRAGVAARFVGDVSGYASKSGVPEHAQKVWDALIELQIPDDWIPRSNDDMHITTAFDRGWAPER